MNDDADPTLPTGPRRWLPTGLLLAATAWLLVVFPSLSAEVALHYDLRGQATDVGARAQLLVLPAVGLLLDLLLKIVGALAAQRPELVALPVKLTADNRARVLGLTLGCCGFLRAAVAVFFGLLIVSCTEGARTGVLLVSPAVLGAWPAVVVVGLAGYVVAMRRAA
jgi:hypothetical protein